MQRHRSYKKDRSMTTIEFLTKKNEIVERVTGKVLDPDDQMEEVPFKELDTLIGAYLADNTMSLHAGICPYCETHREPVDTYKHTRINCDNCIMDKAGNGCMSAKEISTWEDCHELWDELATRKDATDLISLVEQYNKEGEEV